MVSGGILPRIGADVKRSFEKTVSENFAKNGRNPYANGRKYDKMKDMGTQTLHEGHRQRMLHRLETGEESLREHELLEILLFNAIPRRNTNEIAHRLLSAFGSLDGVFNASFQELQTVEGVGAETAAYLRCIALCFARKQMCAPSPKPFDASSFSSLVQERLSGLTEEVIDVYCIDKNEKIKISKRYTSFRRDRASVGVGELSRFLAAQLPYGIVLAHNHPNASCRPSEEDEQFTASVTALCSMHGILFYDHLIVGADGTYSYFRLGRMEGIREAFSVGNILSGKVLR